MSRRPLQRTTLEGEKIAYNYATLAVARLEEMQAFMDKLIELERISSQAVFQKYVRDAHFALPAELPQARSIVVFALYTPLMRALFHTRVKAADILVPPQYYGLGLPKDAASTIVRNEILASSDSRLERLTHGHLKLLAVQSGLAQYGRNNISYVEGMGSFITLAAFVTSETLPDEWTDLATMPQCATCTICLDNCPTGAIRAEEFVIDAGKCLTLYNEISGDFPEWIQSDIHNAYIGCMRCQLLCPANHAVVQDAGRLPDITQDETRAILAADPAAPEIASAANKLRMDLSNEETLRIVSRNVRAILDPGSLRPSAY
ncbi:hypothetical protein IH601_10980 [Candidatus Bipolaricaulota bacterium]|nr:hypothetical protein [Candidatus Bipolaricaulota bacterium]